jgi:hypothetical protein
VETIPLAEQEVEAHAIDTNRNGSDRCRCGSVADQPLHPDAGTIKSILNAVVVIAVVLWLLNVFGLFSSFSHIRVGS